LLARSRCSCIEENNNHFERKRDFKCWTCGDKYSTGHRCTTQKIYNYEVEKKEESSNSNSNEGNKTPNPNSEEENMPRISLVVIPGIVQP